MKREELIKLIDSLELDKEEFWILSSGSLVLRNLLEEAGDLDIAVTQKGLDELYKKYNVVPKGNNWYKICSNIECVLDTKDSSKYEKVGNYNLLSLNEYYKFLEKSTREKDKVKLDIVKRTLINSKKNDKIVSR